MAGKPIRTSHDLADELESVARTLRGAPPVPLTEGQSRTRSSADIPAGAPGNRKAVKHNDLIGLAERLPKMDSASAEPELRALAVNDARELARVLGLRVASKATKDETVALLLAQLFDVPAGQERLRTFHERNRRSA